MEKCADNDERSRSVFVKQDTDNRPQRKQEKELKRRDPGNGAAVIVLEGPIFVILLKDAHTYTGSLVVRLSVHTYMQKSLRDNISIWMAYCSSSPCC